MKKITLLITLLFTSFFGFSQTTYYSEDFNGGDLNGWTTTDLNNDGLEWSVLDASSINAAFGAGSLLSFSYDDATSTAVTPDNLVTSPAINLSAVTDPNVYLLYDQITSTDWPGEHYAVYVTTSNDPATIIASTPVYETTVGSGTLANKFFNLTSHIGETVYVSFRHFNCYDKYYLVLDNVRLKSLASNDAQFVSAKLNRYGLLNSNNTLTFTVKNAGSNAITNLTLNWNDGTDHTVTVPKNIAVGATGTVNHTTTVSYSSVVEKNLALSITAVNGNTDPVPANNTGAAKFNTVSQASPKKVFFEEGTGTWCGWCPRGAIAMAYMDTTYPNEFIGVAVHNQDPMMLADYDGGADFSGFPGMNVDRVVKGADVSQTTMVNNLNARKTLTVPVALNASGAVNGSQITINADATFRTVFANADYRLGVVISEDDVTGTSNGYRQTNYYAAGANGAMGGYETLPNPVPAAQMVYNHVGRALLGGYTGQDSSIPSTITDGQTSSYTFNYTVPATSNIANMHAVVLLIDQSNGEVVNAKSVELATLAVSQNEAYTFNVYPNPASDYINISNLKGGSYTITIFDMLGRAVQTDKREVSDNETFSLPIKGVSQGEYIVNIATGNTSYSKHLLVK
ncbi:T9SS type A sorting domain-containing protein [Flavobacterium wongokense]|uniref:T9SS type A sorting domain-containing protein n=1 Tax=Flavobacterium wongokense TaxID=2910674 RepID=UPI001F46107B|nr:Omp28-related outer membrane protein [Flavobacterium sp. WG47]MCF6131252.1 Omp28-related outer membrane protein [Flavobacterium sp. WG47]